MCTFELVEQADTFYSLSEKWDDLLKDSISNRFYLSHDWLSIWWKNFGIDKYLKIMLIKENGKISLAAPLMLSRSSLMKFPVKQLQFIGTGWGETGFIIRRGSEQLFEPFIKYLKENINGWNVLELYQTSGETIQSLSLPRILQDNNCLLTIEPQNIPYIKLNCSWEDYLKNRSYSFRRNIKNRERKLSKLGKVKFIRYDSSHDLKTFMEQVFQISESSWKAGAGTAISSNKNVKSFYWNLAKKLNQSGLLEISLLTIADKPIAYMFGARYNRTYVDIDIAYDKEYHKVSPGTIIRNYLLMELFDDDGYDDFDFVMNFDYKSALTDDFREYATILAFEKSAYASTLYYLRKKVWPTVKSNLLQ